MSSGFTVQKISARSLEPKYFSNQHTIDDETLSYKLNKNKNNSWQLQQHICVCFFLGSRHGLNHAGGWP